MILKAGISSTVEASGATPAIVLLQPQSGDGQDVKSCELSLDPVVPFRDYKDPYGNLCRRLVLPSGSSTIHASCVVDAPDEIAVCPDVGAVPVPELPDDVLIYLLPSRYCQADLFEKLAASITKKKSPGYGQVEAIRAWIFRKLRYKYGVSTGSTSAVETERKRAGVCRDFSHLGIALCRALQIPARIVFGYLHLLDPMDLHVWFEAFVGGRWYTFDATQKHPRGNRIIVAYGRDAADVAQLTEYGELKVTKQSVWVEPA